MSFLGFFLLYEIMGGFCLFPKVVVDFLSISKLRTDEWYYVTKGSNFFCASSFSVPEIHFRRGFVL